MLAFSMRTEWSKAMTMVSISRCERMTAFGELLQLMAPRKIIRMRRGVREPALRGPTSLLCDTENAHDQTANRSEQRCVY